MPQIFLTYHCTTCDKEVSDLKELHEFQIVPIGKDKQPINMSKKYTQWLCSECSDDLKDFLDKNITKVTEEIAEDLMD